MTLKRDGTEQQQNGGRRPYEPTDTERKQVERYAGLGVTQGDIAKLLGIGKNTLRIAFKTELDHGMAAANANIAGSLYKQAMGIGPDNKPIIANTTATIFWLKCRAGWKEPPQDFRHGGAIGTYDLTKLDDDKLAILEDILGTLAVDDGSEGGDSEAQG